MGRLAMALAWNLWAWFTIVTPFPFSPEPDPPVPGIIGQP